MNIKMIQVSKYMEDIDPSIYIEQCYQNIKIYVKKPHGLFSFIKVIPNKMLSEHKDIFEKIGEEIKAELRENKLRKLLI